MFSLILQGAVALSLVTSAVRIGIVRYNISMVGIGPPDGWLLYGLPLGFYLWHAILVGIAFSICVALVVRSPRRGNLPRFWVGWLVVISLIIFFVIALALRPPVEY
jgi:hypothetical protein